MANYRPTQMPYHSHCNMPIPSPTMCKDVHEDVSLAMAYVKWQTWKDLYAIEKGFQCGTIFKELNMPFFGKRGARG